MHNPLSASNAQHRAFIRNKFNVQKVLGSNLAILARLYGTADHVCQDYYKYTYVYYKKY